MVANQVTLLFGMIPPPKKKKSEVIIKVLPPCPLRACCARARALGFAPTQRGAGANSEGKP